MTLVHVKPALVRPLLATPAFDRLVNEFFNADFPAFANGNGMKSTPSVNVVETADNFQLEIAAPGFNKEDFQVHVDKNLLTIEVQTERQRPQDARVRKQEFNYGAFKRSFQLPDTIDANSIDATYANGVLEVTLPKKEEAKPQPARRIEIA